MRFFTLFLVSFSFLFLSQAQTVEPLYEQRGLSFRGLSAVNDSIVWVSGTKGTVGKSTDGGNTWTWHPVPGYENRDFRDIEAFDDQRAVIIAIDTPAQILYTVNGGLSWTLAFHDPRPGMFLDAIHFENELHGVVIGDPVDNAFFLAETKDGGKSWQNISGKILQTPDSIEAFFAASGTNIIIDQQNIYAVSGGKNSFLHKNGQKFPIPLLNGTSNTGANGMILHQDKFYIVGGDFTKPNDTTGNLVIAQFVNNQLQIQKPIKAPTGYRSGIAQYKNEVFFSCGMNGVDWSNDGGLHWHQISTVGYHTIMKAKKGNSIFMAGGNGRIAKINLP